MTTTERAGSGMVPYYTDSLVTLYHGDCRELLPQMGGGDVVVTDPVWPNADPRLAGAGRPWELFAEVARLFPAVASRLVVPFMGSGTTALAAKDMGLPFIGIEIEERYCEIAAERCRQEVLSLSPA